MDENKDNHTLPPAPHRTDSVSPSPMPHGQDRIAALKELGATFIEGNRRISKIATPTGSERMPTFVDAGQIEELLLRKTTGKTGFDEVIQ
ncbi:hypothetical protein DFQ28_005292 [Apophysomyces sp. BC1034]|nr:hypothetical protein DFQ30_005010 [Apophysomyces sp. BC1015]KAG0177944.1 hypothetical protein DFQ29_004155 [Apophysomyces sp. BC1021]KAG0188171.1 hypothetical protein DFQ28_005292 [Apophysomyces sp. BC1034]